MSRNYSGLVYAIVMIQVSVVFCATLRRDVGVDELHQKLEADEELVIPLAEEICYDLQTYHNESSPFTIEDCQNSFLKSHGEKFANPPKVDLRCQYQSNIVYSLETDQVHEPDSWTLVVLTPLNTSVGYLTYDLVKTNDEEFRDLNVFPPGYYRLWTSRMSSFGTHSSWLKGPDIKTWNLTGEVRPRSHHIRTVPQFQAADDNSTVTVSITWDPIDDKDKCFDFVNKCNGVLSATKIWPNGSHSRKVAGLPLGASCEVRLRGRHGLTVKQYQTPTCDKMDACLNYNMAQNISLMAEPAADGWDIYVQWARTHQPLFYNVTLFTENGTASVQLPGNTTETMFPGVQGDGIYTVAIGSMYKGRTVYTSERAMFPPEAAPWGALGSIMGGAWGVLACSGILLVAAFLLWRRKQHGRPTHIYFPEPMDKPDGLNTDCDGIDQESLVAEDCWELQSERLLLHEVIGEGAFGVVRRGTLSPAGKEVAVKMLKDFPTLEEIRSFLAEMELMKSVGAHAHIVCMLGCCGGRRPFIVAEYCGRGDLLSYLRRSWDVMVSKRNAKYYNNNNNIESTDYRNDLFNCKPSGELSKLVVNKLYDLQGICDPDLTIRDLLSFCRQIAMGMEFLASNRLVHRDLAARNVLVSNDRTLKIADFGLSRDVYEENLYKQKGNGKMPMKWMALESLTRRIYTTQSDVWSFGVVMWEVSSVGGAPYAGVAPARLPRLLRAGYRMPRPANCTKQLYEVMLSCWRAHPRERPTFGELHARLDELLGACAQEYLCLEDCDELPPPASHKYVPTIIREKLGWFRGESYERPLRTTHNHYSSPPATHKLQQVS